MIFLFIIALIGFAIACPGITIFLFWFFTRPLVIGAIIIFVLISVISICVTENRHEEKSASDDVAPQEKGDWYIHYLSQPQEEQDENDVAGLHNENISLDNPPDIYRDKKTWHIQTLSEQRAKNKKNDREANMALFSWFKYDKEGYDKNGFDREGYNRSGYDKDGYNREGFNQDGFDYYGYDKYGFDKDGYNDEGYNRLGFDVNGFSKSGFDKEGYDQAGYNRQGFDRHGYDKEGYSPTGYDANCYNRQGYTRDGFGRDGYNLEGYNRLGFDANGFNKLGFDKNGFDHDGYNAEGYNAEGYNKLGFDSDGYDKSGFDKEGYDRNGFSSYGFDRYGYDRDGYDKSGFNAEGYNRVGFNRCGYDRDGYDKSGFNAEGYNRVGFDKYGYDRDGYDKSGFNAEGYNRVGFDANGFDRSGFNKEGYDRSGFNRQGFNKEGYDREGFNDQGFDKDGYDKNGCDLNGFDRLGRASCPECHGKIPKRQYKFCPECGCPIIYVKRSEKGRCQENAAVAPEIKQAEISTKKESIASLCSILREVKQTEIPTEKEDLLGIFSEYERLIILDTETSGLDADRHQIIELAFVELKRDECFQTVRTYDKFIKLYNEGQKLDAKIVELTGITSEMLEENGITRTEAIEEISEIFSAGKTLVFAYNAQFDIHFLANFLKGSDGEKCIKAWDYLDVLTVYKDRRPYPHKLRNAISAYHLENEVANTHRAIDDVQATLAILKAMIQEKPDVFRYVNLFGYNPKWGISGRRIEKIRYVAQPYNQRKKLYEVGI